MTWSDLRRDKWTFCCFAVEQMVNSLQSWKGKLSIRQQFATRSVWQRARQVHLNAQCYRRMRRENPWSWVTLRFFFLRLSSSRFLSLFTSLCLWSSPSLSDFIYLVYFYFTRRLRSFSSLLYFSLSRRQSWTLAVQSEQHLISPPTGIVTRYSHTNIHEFPESKVTQGTQVAVGKLEEDAL